VASRSGPSVRPILTAVGVAPYAGVAMKSRCRVRVAVVAALLAIGASGPAPAQTASPITPLFRVILNDGTALVSFGEFTRVGDRIVFSMPLDSPRGDRLQLVNLPDSVVNWESTQQYADAARYAQYVATRAESDFAVLTGEMARVLNEIVLTKEPTRRLQLAEQTRRILSAWPLEHFGYRSSDINDMVSLLEGTISDLRGAAGVRRFDFSLVATVEPPTMPLLSDPSPAQAIEQVLVAARLSDVPAERITLLRSVISVIDQNRAKFPRAWARRTRAAADALLEAELDTERRYAELSRVAVAKATAAAAGADVRGVEQALATLQARDSALGRKRKDQMAGLLDMLQDRLDSARRLRLMRDQWARKAENIRAYQGAASGPIDRLAKLRPKLELVKALAGPDYFEIADLIQRFERISRQLALITPPPDLLSAHATLKSAAELGQQAMRTRERAAMSGDMATAWDASSAAAGSILMLGQARQQIDALSRPPELR
jgi:hypothetical protein